ncbi:unnamed protein product, partial [Aphanomyces euteiches]
ALCEAVLVACWQSACVKKRSGVKNGFSMLQLPFNDASEVSKRALAPKSSDASSSL